MLAFSDSLRRSVFRYLLTEYGEYDISEFDKISQTGGVLFIKRLQILTREVGSYKLFKIKL